MKITIKMKDRECSMTRHFEVEDESPITMSLHDPVINDFLSTAIQEFKRTADITTVSATFEV